MGKRFCRLMGVWVIIGRTGMDFSLSMLFPFLAALANALYQIVTRLLHRADLPFLADLLQSKRCVWPSQSRNYLGQKRLAGARPCRPLHSTGKSTRGW
jgi:hypothetical protein